MAKQLNVNLAFTANTSEAKAQLQSLQQQLNQLANTPIKLKGQKLTQEILEASNAAAELKVHLQNATNVQTGNLDFTKLNQSIKNSGSSLAAYGEKLKALGSAGNTAFQALAQSVAKAEIPIRRSNAMLTEMWVTLKNTARWQLSSSVLHGFMGAVQSAYGYAQDLNKSLNDIRIVSGQNTDQMAKFAEEANKAARALSTTTTEYTNASLIYYQQGLSDSEVAKRTEVTVKMANAAGVSAEKVSDQLTAVWNNFAKGGENLEYYADVMTALGAATASSTDEISEGLNKFASVAETVGLSYEYAASALATVTATTRQSADIVGTAFKTLFARIQDLELGETLDDGTTLGTYSKALEKVGINIKDTSGEMKKMDVILEEMASKWGNLEQAEKTALAQSVAGVRQYTQLIALMDNWDFMKENLATSYGASGTLDQQAKIYAESWEAARDRVRAASEAIYSDLLDDKFFIKFLGGFEKFLVLIDNIIDSMGGLKGVLSGVSAIILRTFSSQISQSLTNMAYNFQTMTKAGRQKIQNEQTSFITNAAQSLNPTDENSTAESVARESSLKKQLQLQVDMINNTERMSAEEIEVNQMLLDRVRLIGEEVALRSQALDLAQQEVQQASLDARTEAIANAQFVAGSDDQLKAGLKGSKDYTEAATQLKQEIVYEENINNQLNQIRQSGEVTSQSINDIIVVLQKLNNFSDDGILDGFIADLNETSQKLEGNSISAEDFEKQLRDISKVARGVVKVTGEKKMSDIGVSDKNIKGVVDGYKKEAQAIAERNKVISEEQKLVDDLSNRIVNAQGSQKNWSDTIVASAQHISSLSMGLSSLGNIVDTISNPDLSGFEKMSSVIMSLSMGIPMLISGISGLNTVLGVSSAIQNAAAFSAQLYLNAHKEELATLTAETVAKGANISLDEAELALSNAKALAKLKELNLTGAEIAEMSAKALAQKTGMTLDQAEIMISKLKAGSTLAEATAEAGLNSVKMTGIAATVAQTYAKGLESGARWANVVAIMAEYTALSPLLVIVLALAAAIALVAGLVWGIVEAFKAWKASTPEGQLKAVTEQSKELKTALDDAKNAATELKSAFDDYDSVVETLENCTEGTQEWRDALRDVNNEVLGLLSEYPELATMTNAVGQPAITKGEHGELVVEDWARDQLIYKADQAVANTQTASIAANRDVREAQIVVDTKSLAQDLTRATADIIANGIMETTDPDGNVYTSGFDGSTMMKHFITENAKKLSEVTPDEQKRLLQAFADYNNITTNIDAWTSAITDLGPKFGELAGAIEANTIATQIENETIAANILADKQNIQQSGMVDEITKIVASDLDKDIEARKKALKDSGWGTEGINKATGVNDEVREIFAEYAKAAGITNYDLIDTTGTDKNRNFIYNDGEKEVTVSLEAMRAVVAASEANVDLVNNANQLVQILTNKTAEEIAAITAAATGNIEDLTVAQAREDFDIKAFADTLSQKDLEAMGYEGDLATMRSNYIEAYNEVAKNAQIALTDIIDDYTQSVQDSMNKLKNSGSLDDLTLGQVKAFGESLTKVFSQSGSEGISILDEILVSTGDDADELATVLGNVDWQTTNVNELTKMLEDAGINTDSFADKLAKLVGLMQDGQNIGFDAAAEQYNKTSSIANKIKNGENISNEDYQWLETIGINLEGAFTRVTDGSWKLMTDAETFYELVNSASLDPFISNIEALTNQYGRVGNLTENYSQESIQEQGYTEYYMGNGHTGFSLDTEQMQAQLDFLGAVNPEAVNEVWQSALENGELTLEQAREIQAAVEANSGAWNNLEASQNGILDDIYQHYDAMAMQAQSIDELNQLLENGQIDLAAYEKAIESVGVAEAEAHGLDPEQFEDLSEMIEESADAIEGLSKDLKGNEKEANDVAKAILRYDKAVQAVRKDYDKWNDILESNNLQDHAEIIDDVRAAYGDLLDIDASTLSDTFLRSTENLDLMRDAANGSEEAYNKLMQAVQEDIIAHCDLNKTAFDAASAELQTQLDALNFQELEIGASLNSEGALQAMTDLVNAAGMTAEQATSYLASMGVDAEVVEEQTEQTDPVSYVQATPIPIRRTVMGTNPVTGLPQPYTFYGTNYDLSTVKDESTKKTTAVALKVVSANKSSGGGFKHKNSSSGSGSNSGGGGGGGGGGGKSSTPAEKVDVSKPSDFGERYHTINKQIDNMSREMERASKAADKLWSRKRLKYLEEQNKMLDEEIALLQEKTRQAEEYLEQDTADLNSTATDLGFTISYGEDGEILNYDAIRDAYAQQMIEAQQHMNSLSTKEEQDAYQESVIDPLQKKIDAFEEAMKLYYDSLETIQENADLIQEKLDQKLQNNFDIWAGELELDIEVNERDLELIEYYLGKIEDDVYQMAEAAALMVGSLDGMKSGNFGGQLGEYLSNLDIYKTKLDELNQKFAAGEITEAAYEEGLEQIRSGILDNLQSVQELDDAMLEYYSDTLSAVMDEMDKYTDKLEHQTAILEHYANMMEILGKSYDYESMGVILEGQVKTIENELKVAEAEYDLYQKEAEEKRKLYEEAVKAGNVDAAEVYKKEWEAAEEAAIEAQSEMLDKTEQWAEAMRAVVENKLKGFAQDLEKSLTGGTTFDQINLQLERAAALQEEYLTTTNKIYETNKLMRTAQQEMDKTSNSVAKQRLKDFIKETNQLQDKSKLSKYELEIQQAKYDLLLAQLALEDAQNAKSMVRLQRDSEGNFGYVYTADQNKLLEAQQALEDAQNNLYNIGLEGANDYTEKYAETMQEMYDTLTSITEAYYNGEIASHEEYEAQMLAAQQYYYEQLENYQDLYGIALQTDTRVIKDAWSTGMQIMTIETSDWQNAVEIYTNKATETLVAWYAQVDAIANKTGLDNIANKVKKVTDESDKLKETILGSGNDKGVIGALADELDAVSNLTGGYANLRAELQSLIEDYEELIKTVLKIQNTPDGPVVEGETVVEDEEVKPEEEPEEVKPEESLEDNVDPSTPILKKGDSVTVKKTATHFSRNGGNGTRMRSFVPGSTYNVMDFDDDEVMIGRDGVVTGWVKKTDLVGFNTGGYTGSWGPYGKLAILDEKELVLNQGDTANFLASMEVLERILEMIDIQSASAQLGGLLTTPAFGGNNSSSSIEQNVHIEASFPGVTDRNEIEEAFNNLINTASQYANRKI